LPGSAHPETRRRSAGAAPLVGEDRIHHPVEPLPRSGGASPFADFINTTTKHVFTSRPLGAGWDRSVAVETPLSAYVEQLKLQPGGDIGVHGSITLAGDLLAADLVDRLELVVVPTLAGAGRRLFGDHGEPTRLTLTKASSSPSGCVFLSYERPGSATSHVPLLAGSSMQAMQTSSSP
jgi:dihydrofolate reductase